MSILKRVISLLLCIVMLTSVLASCDTDDSHNHETGESTNEQPQGTTSDHTHDETEPSDETTETLEQHTHTPAIAVTENLVDSTCTKTGSYDEVVYCSVCHEEISRTQKTIDKKAHDYTEKVATSTYLKTEASCEDKAVYYYSCSCGAKETTATFTYGEANGHSYSSSWEKNATHHWHKATCEHTGEISGEAEHNYGTDNICDTCEYDRTVNVSGVELNFSSLALTVDDVETLIATTTPNNATNQSVTWTTSNASIVAVDANGKITAVGVGTAIITVTTEDGNKTAQCTVVVSAKICPHTTTRTERENEVDSTCGETGTYDEVVYCSTCGDELSRTEKTIPKKNTHTNATPVHENIVDSTCKDTGSYDEVVYCSICDKELSRTEKTIDKKTTHTEDEAVTENLVDSTCKVEGSFDEVVYCSICGHEISRTEKVISKKNTHTQNSSVKENIVDSTCAEEGSYDEVVYCSVCGVELSRVEKTIEKKTTHTEAEAIQENIVDSTCGETGSYDEVVYCSVCGKELRRTEKTIDKKNTHTEGEPVQENYVDSTFEEKGSYDSVIYCTVCGKELSRNTITIPEKSHTAGTAVVENKVDSTCGKTGTYDEVVYCTECGEELSRVQKTIEKKTTHTEDETVIENFVDSTCAKEGSYNEVVYCSICEVELSRTFHIIEKKTTHTHASPVQENFVDSTCKTEGAYDEVIYCSICDIELNRETKTVAKKTTHIEDDAVIENLVDSTCKVEGSYDEVVYCSVCDVEISRTEKTITKKGTHTEGEAVVESYVDSTFEAKGSYDEVIYCTVCDKELSRTTITIPEKHHTPAEAVIENTVDSTCAEEGSYDEVVYCSVCGEELSRVVQTIAKKDTHTEGSAVEENRVEADCQNEGSYDTVVYCTVCDKELSRTEKTIDKKPHTNGTPVIENKIDSTCKVEGSYDEVVYCAVCDKELSRTQKVIEKKITHTEDEAVIENYVDSSCSETGSYDTVVYCSACDKELSRVAHTIGKKSHTQSSPVQENFVDSTCTTVGSYDMVVYCSVCEEELSRVSNTIDKKAHVYNKEVATETYLKSDATCTEKAVYYYSCVCGEKGTTATFTSGNPLGHSYASAWEKNDTHHWHKATCEHTSEVSAKAEHNYGSDLICDTCGYEREEDKIIFSTLQVNGTDVYGKVSNTTTTFSFINEIEVSGNATYTVSLDIYGMQVVATKTVALAVGDNTFYVLETIGNDIKLYTVTIRRRPMYPVTFDTNGGTAVESQTVEEDSNVTIPTTTKTGYTFAGWDYDLNTAITQDTTITANWTANEYTITYDANGGSVDNATQTVTYDAEYTLTVPMRTGYTFLGWLYNEERYQSGTWSETRNITLTAEWEIITYDISYSLNGGSHSNSATYTVEEAIVLTAPTKTGYTFLGWTYDGQTEPVLNVTIAKGTIGYKSYTANWSANEYTITYNANGGAVESTTQTVIYDSAYMLATPTREGYTFIGWFYDGVQYESGIWETAENITLTALWDINKYQVSIDKDVTIRGTVRGSGEYCYGESVTVCASNHYLGYTWVGWYDASNNLLTTEDSFSFIIGTTNMVLTPKWEIKEEMLDFRFVSTETTCAIAWVLNKDKTAYIIPDYVTSIGEGAFSGCKNLTDITLPFIGKSKNVMSDEYIYPIGYIFGTSSYAGGVETKQYYQKNNTSGTTKESTYYIPASLKSVTITGETIPYGAFYGCNLADVTISERVKSIGENAFYGCYSITKVYITDIVAWCNISFDRTNANPLDCNSSSILYLNNEILTDIIVPDGVTAIGLRAFSGYKQLTSITIPDSVIEIGDYAFDGCIGLTSITIPDSVTRIGNYAFHNCRNLTSIEMSNSLTVIGSYAFYYCNNLTSITIPEGITNIGDYAFYNCTALTEINFNAISMYDLSWNNYMFYKAGENGNGITVNIGANVTKIPASLFKPSETSSVQKIKSISFAAGSVCKNIGGEAFRGCSGLTSITLPNSITSIGYFAFKGCSSLTTIIIPDSVTSIGDDAFNGCSSLESLSLPFVGAKKDGTSNTHFGYIFGASSYSSNADYIPASLKTVIITNITHINGYAFYGCNSLTSITIPESVTSIGYCAFYGCSGITSFTIPNGVTSIELSAFNGCDSISSVYYGGSSNSWDSIAILDENTSLLDATRYYYCASQPTEEGNYWYYDENGIPTIWA